MLRRYLFAAVYLLVAFGALAADFSLSNFTLESSERVFGIPATWDLTYRADATNETLDDYTDLRLVIDAPPDVIEVIDGDLHFGAVPAGASVPSLDTFTLRESRRDLRSDYPYPPEDLQWVLWNTPPVADAGADQTVDYGATAILNGSDSYDLDGDPLTFAWQILSQPDGSTTVLDDPTSVMPTFVVDAYGKYEIELVVNDGAVDSAPDTVLVETGNVAPTANAGPDQSVLWGETVTLDGSGSSDPNGDSLTFLWEIVATPAGSIATLDDPTLVKPSFTVDVSGDDIEYVIELTVSDGEYEDSDTVRVTTDNSAPVADAGPDQSGFPGDTITLDGSGSTDVDGDSLTFSWSLSVPTGSAATLSDPVAVMPTFYVDVFGDYVAQLVVNDGTLDSSPDTTTVSPFNIAPVADAGPNQSGAVGDTITFDGSGSFDVDGDALTFGWSFTSVPPDSAAAFDDPTLEMPSFDIDINGDYVAQLVVNDGAVNSAADTVTASTINSSPEADAGPDQTVEPGETVQLDGSGSLDADGDSLTYSWSFTSRPGGSDATLSDPHTETPSFVADEAGLYVVQLIVYDGQVASAPDTVKIDAGSTSTPSLSLSPDPLDLKTFETGSLTITLSEAAGPGGLVVDLSSDDPMVASVPATATIADGDTTASVQVTAGAAGGSAQIAADAAGYAGDTSTVNVTLRGLTLTLDDLLVGVGRSIGGTLTLGEPAPAGGVAVSLASADDTVATVAPASVTIPEGDTSASLTVTGVSVGVTQVNASAAGCTGAAAPVEVTDVLINLGTIPVLGPDESASLSVSLSAPAPTGGVTVNLVSSDPAIATVDASVFIPEGLQIPAANPQVTAVKIGTTQILASASGFASDTRDVVVTVELSFSPTSLAVIASETKDIQLVLSAPAPTGGLTLNLSTDDPGIASVPAAITILAGQTSGPVPVTGVTVGDTLLRASAPGVSEATAATSVTLPPTIKLPASVSVGKDLQAPFSITLGQPAPAGGLTLTLTSSDGAQALVSSSRTAAGGTTATLSFTAGATTATAYVQALGNTGVFQVTASAPGYVDGTMDVALSPSGFRIQNSDFTTTSFSADTPVALRSGRLREPDLAYLADQEVRGGLTVEVPVTSSDTTVGVITVSPVSFVGGTGNYKLTAFDPLAYGTTVIAIAQPPGFDAPSNVNTQITATVTAPVISVSNANVGEDLQAGLGLSLPVAPPSPVDVTITVADPSIAVISPDRTAAGSGSLTLSDISATSLGTFYVQGLSQGTTSVTLTAPGYESGTGTITVSPSGFYIAYPTVINTTSFSADTTVALRSARLRDPDLGYVATQEVRGGLTVAVSVTSSDTAVGVITTSPVSFVGGTGSEKYTGFDPIAFGTTVIALAQPPGFDIPSNGTTQITATVTAPAIRFSAASTTTGRDLQAAVSVSLEAAPPSPVDVTVSVASGTVALVSASRTETGSTSITFPAVTSTFLRTLYVQGLAVGDTELRAQAAGYIDDNLPVAVEKSGFYISNPAEGFDFDVSGPNQLVGIRSAVLNRATELFVAQQEVRGGISIAVDVTSSDTGVGVITLSPVTFIGGEGTYRDTQFDPLAVGPVTIAVTQPPGFTPPANLNTTVNGTVSGEMAITAGALRPE